MALPQQRSQIMSNGGMAGRALTILNSALPNSLPNPMGLVNYTPLNGAAALAGSAASNQPPRRVRGQSPTIGLPAPIDYSSNTF